MTADGDQFDADNVEFSRHMVLTEGARGAVRLIEPEHAYGVSIREAGLVVTGPDSVVLKATATVPADIATSQLDFASWVEVTIQLPTSGAGRTAVARQRLDWSSGHNSSNQAGVRKPRVFAQWSVLRR
ncbi:hypothetical protein [Nocardia sp. NPDC051981]|uniref:hypothetical protein n=1 Tax=Nocardia sp. NPDC051981 TaxID=3155417 RepID=UPI00343CB1F5